MKRGAFVLVAFTAFVAVALWFFGPQWYRRQQQVSAEKTQILWAVRSYIAALEQKQLPVPAFVTLNQLIKDGYLEREEVAAWDTETKVPTVAHGLPPRRSVVRNDVSAVVSNRP